MLIRLFCRFEVYGAENIKKAKGPLVIVANHKSCFDPTLIGVVGLLNFRLFPIRFMAQNQLFKYPLFNLLVWLLDAFRAYQGFGIEKSLVYPIKILRRGGTIMMFPGGKVVQEKEKLGKGRKGVAILAMAIGAELLPIALRTPNNFTLWCFIFKRPRLVVKIGSAFELEKKEFNQITEENVTESTNLIMKEISDLYFTKVK